MKDQFDSRLSALKEAHLALVQRPNQPEPLGNGIFKRYEHPVLTAAHAPLSWRYDYRKAGLYWDHQEFGGHYYRPMSAGATMNALAGLSILRNEYRFNPPRLTKGTDRFFFAASTGTGLFIADEKGRCGIKAHSGFLELQSLGLSSECWAQGKDAGLLLNGQKVEIAKWTEEPECLVAHFVAPLKMQEGKMLKVV